MAGAAGRATLLIASMRHLCERPFVDGMRKTCTRVYASSRSNGRASWRNTRGSSIAHSRQPIFSSPRCCTGRYRAASPSRRPCVKRERTERGIRHQPHDRAEGHLPAHREGSA